MKVVQEYIDLFKENPPCLLPGVRLKWSKKGKLSSPERGIEYQRRHALPECSPIWTPAPVSRSGGGWTGKVPSNRSPDLLPPAPPRPAHPLPAQVSPGNRPKSGNDTLRLSRRSRGRGTDASSGFSKLRSEGILVCWSSQPA